MNGSLIQLLVLAGIAIFLILKLRSVLGTRDGFEKPPIPLDEVRPRLRRDFEVIEGGPDRDITDHVAEGSDAARALAEMKKAEPGFAVGPFLQGARGAYEMILMAFEKGELDRIRPFLSDDVEASFAEAIAAREALCAAVQADTGATAVHPYTDPRVIAGQGTAALELLTAHPDLDALVVPLGGGGLAAGTALAMRALAPDCRLYLAEPEGAADGARSFARGTLDIDFVPDTICDGLRGSLGAINFAMLRAAGAQVLTVDDAQTVAAMRQLWSRSKQLVEPSSATALAAVLAHPAHFEGRKVGIILSGGNVDLDALPALFAIGGNA